MLYTCIMQASKARTVMASPDLIYPEMLRSNETAVTLPTKYKEVISLPTTNILVFD